MPKDDFSDILTPEIKFQLVRKIELHKVVALSSTRLLAHEEKYLEFHKCAGVILFERNVESFTQLGELLDAVRSKASVDGLDPLVMADHEGDLVSELRRVIGAPPSPMAIAATGNLDLAESVAEATGEAMLKLGVNCVLAPSADCCFDLSNPVTGLRCFGRDPTRIADFVGATLRGYGGAGILCCAKHFPGHGSTRDDSHERVAVVEKSPERLREEDLVPFKRAITDGVDMIMVGHIASRSSADSELRPATFDAKMIGELLRGELGFGGVVITDALEMGGARSHAGVLYGGLASGLERPLLYGADLLLFAEPVPEKMFLGEDGSGVMSVKVMEMIIHTLEKVVDRERIERKLKEAADRSEGIRNMLRILEGSEERIRGLREKATRALPTRGAGETRNVIDFSLYPSVPPIYKEVAERSIVLIRDESRFVPVDGTRRVVLVPVKPVREGSLKDQDLVEFTSVLLRHFPSWRATLEVNDFGEGDEGIVPVFGKRDNTTQGGFLERIPEDEVEIVLVYSTRGAPPEGWTEKLTRFVESYNCNLVIVTGWPLVEWVPDHVGVLITLGASPQAAAACCMVLSGEIEPIAPPPFLLRGETPQGGC